MLIRLQANPILDTDMNELQSRFNQLSDDAFDLYFTMTNGIEYTSLPVDEMNLNAQYFSKLLDQLISVGLIAIEYNLLPMIQIDKGGI